MNRVSDYTITSISEVANMFAEHGWPGEMKFLTGPLGNEQVAITYRKMPKNSGGKGGYGHFHQQQEEVIYVINGEIEVKVGDEVKILRAGEVIRITPKAVRSIDNSKEQEAELLIISTKLPDDQDDAKTVPDFWPQD